MSLGMLANCGELAATDRPVQILFALAGVATRFCMAAGAHHGDAERSYGIAQRGRLTRAQDDSDLRKGYAQRAEQLNEFPVG